jgi:hypothetical protein
MLANADAATVVAINAHYWVDMFLWRFQTAERPQRLAQDDPFLTIGPQSAAAS